MEEKRSACYRLDISLGILHDTCVYGSIRQLLPACLLYILLNSANHHLSLGHALFPAQKSYKKEKQTLSFDVWLPIIGSSHHHILVLTHVGDAFRTLRLKIGKSSARENP